jgi:thioredoxin reductase (NADPH)
VEEVNVDPEVSKLFPRYEQTFPTLTAGEVGRLRRFGSVRRFAAGETLFVTGKPSAGMFVVLSGDVNISQRDGFGRVTPIVKEGPGQFLAELGLLARHAVSLVDGRAETDTETLLISPEGVRALLIAEAELGERIMRALILRRVSLVQDGAGGPVLIGASELSDVARLQTFLARNTIPHHVLEPEHDEGAANLVARYAASDGFQLPLVLCPDGTVLCNPSEQELARRVGMIPEVPDDVLYDVAIVGSGPAGLATAVYAASEGLSVAVLDARSFGGQAGASARIENYLGFPTGISGLALAGRAYAQATKFGADILIPCQVDALVWDDHEQVFALQLAGGQSVRGRAVVVASGARYRRPDIAKLREFEGKGVWYWASPIEAKHCRDQEVFLVGGGNSAGQAAVFLAGYASRVWMMVRGPGLAETMSRYLVDRIAAAPNIGVLTRTEILELYGEPATGLEHIRWIDRCAGVQHESPARNVFVFVGADPATDWLTRCGVKLDRTGFVVTGARPESPLESDVPGVFAVGDVRAGSIKRVGAAIGEGAQVVAALHHYLASRPRALAPMPQPLWQSAGSGGWQPPR